MRSRNALTGLVFALVGACSQPPGEPVDVGERRDQSPDVTAVADVAVDVSIDAADLGLPPTDLGHVDVEQPELRDAELLSALRRDAQASMRSLGYNAARDAMYAAGGVEDQNGRIEGVYTGRTVTTDGTRTPGTNCALAGGMPTQCLFNTEHTVPRVVLRNAFGEGTPDYNTSEGDIHHLFPTEEQANNARGNFAFGETGCLAAGNCAFDEQSQIGLPVGGSGPTNCPTGVDAGEDLCVMHVRPERRGDIARAVFYMSMRYRLELDAREEEALRRWHMGDPPDEYERRRNTAAEVAQGNRNPFVDEPTLIDRIANF